jgi:hypothetical protein
MKKNEHLYLSVVAFLSSEAAFFMSPFPVPHLPPPVLNTLTIKDKLSGVTHDRDVLHVLVLKKKDYRQGIKLLVMFAC